jgi:hypothetical protein
MADERPPGRVFLTAAYLVLLVLGATLATIGAFLVPAGPRIGSFLVSYGVIVAVVTNPGAAVLGARLTGTRLGAAAPLAAWLIMLWVLNSRPEGDRVPPFDVKGGIFLVAGLLAGVITVVIVRTERGVTALGFNLLGAAARPAPRTTVDGKTVDGTAVDGTAVDGTIGAPGTALDDRPRGPSAAG